MPASHSSAVATAIKLMTEPSAADAPRRPVISRMVASPASMTHTVVLGWIEMPFASQSVRRGISRAHPRKEINPAVAEYTPSAIPRLRMRRGGVSAAAMVSSVSPA
jgi:hypothetical protein